MKTTIELPDDLFRDAKATAARDGLPMRALVEQALRDHLARRRRVSVGRERWRRVFGAAERERVREVDAVVAEELESVDPDSWR